MAITNENLLKVHFDMDSVRKQSKLNTLRTIRVLEYYNIGI